MLSGEYRHSIDDKGRVIIPAKFRAALADGVYVTRGLDGCLFAFPLDAWEAMAQKLVKLSLMSRDARYFSRMMFSGDVFPLDKLGRINLPAPLLDHANIEVGQEVVIVGVNSRLEIWSTERWRRVTERIEKESDLFAEQLAELGL
ncbi:MAG: division/cell wall cluster transcriptional repressor MraZ [Anaerolineae bacterium]